MPFNCRICGKNTTPPEIFHCAEHYRCEDCGTREKLCTYPEAVLCQPCKDKRVSKRIAEFDGDHAEMDEVVCPHCGYTHSDSQEFTSGRWECHDCGRSFDLDVNYTVTYTTSKYHGDDQGDRK